jgi:pimeloyl-ACP methyl ester carboxylesterase
MEVLNVIKSTFYAMTPERKGILAKFIKPAPTATALLIHGLSSGSRTWDDAVVMLMNKDFNVLTLDLSGHGDSARLDEYSVDTWIQNVLDVLDRHNISKVDLIMGHSLGGLISVGVATRFPVDKIILIDPLIAPVHPIVAALFKQSLFSRKNNSLKLKLQRKPNRHHQMLINEVEHATKWDSNTINGITKEGGMLVLKEYGEKKDKPPMMIVKPIKSALLNKKDLEELSHWNAEIVELDKVGHGVHLDDFSGFSNTIQPFIEKSFR